jgi:protease-4
LNSMYEYMLHQIGTSRSLTVDKLKSIANSTPILYPEQAYQASLITNIGHLDQAETLINTQLGVESDSEIHYVEWEDYSGKPGPIQKPRPNIAVLVASGVIVDSPNQKGMEIINSKNFIETLKELRENTQVKAIVLRINSPGGSAVASESIWKELVLTNATKPVVASMSDVAASGGYYIATACEHIVAHPITITGSIGIFGVYYDVDTLLKDKIGITRDGVKTSPSADLLTISRRLSIQEKAVLQKQVERGYDIFLDRVATGRQMQKENVAQLAEGRVWSGSLAKEHGLVDELGGLEQAIKKAAELAGIKDGYKVSYWPKPNTWLEGIIYDWQAAENNKLMSFLTKLISFGLNTDYLPTSTLQDLKSVQGMQARLPYKLEID